MRYLIISDLHGSYDTFKLLERIARKIKADRIISAGDFCPTTAMEYEAANLEFVNVMGNCDRWHTYSILPDPREHIDFKLSGRRVVVAHGDRTMPSTYGLEEGDLFISGHTHIPRLGRTDSGIILFNPGSPSRPRSTMGPTYGILEEDFAAVYPLESSSPLLYLEF